VVKTRSIVQILPVIAAEGRRDTLRVLETDRDEPAAQPDTVLRRRILRPSETIATGGAKNQKGDTEKSSATMRRE